MLYTYLTDSLYIVWCGQLLRICDWGVWRYLETDMRIVLTPFLFCNGNHREQIAETVSDYEKLPLHLL